MSHVSVVTVVHNGMPFLPATVESVAGQSYADFEHVIVDDGSTDGTSDYLAGLTDPRVRVIRRGKIGLVAARNLALQEANGELIANIDADDIAYRSRVARQVEFLKTNPDHVVVGSQADLIDPNDAIVGERRFPLGDTALRFRILFGCPFLHPATTYRREATLRCGGFREEFTFTEDYELWSRLALEGRIANLDEKLIAYRMHPKSVTSKHADVHTEHSCRLVADFAERLRIPVEREALATLFRFLQSGVVPGFACMNRLPSTLADIRDLFLQAASSDPELSEQIEFVQKRLRWHCHEHAKRHLLNPFRFWRWVRLAGKFDPENGTLRSIAGRALRKLLRSGKPKTTNENGKASNVVGVH